MPVDLARVEELFAEAVTKTDAARRAAWLGQACGDDAELRERVEQLLRAHDATGNFLKLPGANGATSPFEVVIEGPKSKIGRYKLLEQIGEGGFGVVFMAEQEEPVRRLVALKIIKLGMDTRQVIARFEAERQALAMMDHPSVAKVLDGGATDTGRPYFVMELVKGTPITDYCDQQHLSIRQRLELMTQVCQAVQHAHQKGLIHRDIKPSNVLVTTQDDRPVAKVIDFGVAKAMQARLTEKTLFTEFKQLIGTPAYMSPEQADGSLDIDTRSDVYSLGVLLYELLTGAPPFDPKELRSKAFAELQRIIREVEPPTPSTRLSSLSRSGEPSRTSSGTADTPSPGEGPARLAVPSLVSIAAHRAIEPRKLAAMVRGELDWIVMRAIEKDRKRRYQTANALVQDIQHYLTDQPIEARPATRTYRLRKFIRRNKTEVLASTFVAAVLIAGLVLSSIGFLQARRQAEIARTQAARSDQVAQFLKDMLAAAGPSVARGRDATILREILQKTSERIERDLADQPEVQGDLWFTIGRTYRDIGDHNLAVPVLQCSVDSYRKVFGDSSNKLALALGSLGSSEGFVGNVRDGKAHAERGLAIARRGGDMKTIATCLSNLASTQHFAGTIVRESESLRREELALRRQLDDPLALASTLLRLAGSIDSDDEAEKMRSEAIKLYRENAETDSPQYASALFIVGQSILDREKFEEAELILREAHALFRRIHATDYPFQQNVREYLFYTLARQDKIPEAEALLQMDLTANPTDVSTWRAFGVVYAVEEQWQLAAEHYSRACELNSNHPKLAFPLAIVLLQVGRHAEYKKVCGQFLTTALNGKNPRYRDMAAKAALLLPVDGEDFNRACEIADGLAETTNEEWFTPWTGVLKSLADLRRGQLESAVDLSDRVASDSKAFSECRAPAWFILASARAKLHQLDLAKANLAVGLKLVNEEKLRGHRYGSTWLDWLIADILRREAAHLIGDQSASAPRP